jgi:hypothetical protein
MVDGVTFTRDMVSAGLEGVNYTRDMISSGLEGVNYTRDMISSGLEATQERYYWGKDQTEQEGYLLYNKL